MTDWTEPFLARYRFMRVDHSTYLETEEVGNLEQSGSITRNQDTSLKESGKLTAHGRFDIGPDFLRVYLDATGLYTGWEESVALGTFITSASDRDIDGPYSKSSVNLTGLLKMVDDDDFDAPVTLEAGQPVVQYVRQVLEGCGLWVEADDSDYSLSAAWTFGAGSGEDGKLSAVNELLDMAGFSSARTDEMGVVQLRRYVEPSKRSPSHEFVEGRNARFLSQMTEVVDSSKVKNVMRVIYTSQNKTVVGVAEDNDPSSRWSTVTLGRRVVGTERYQDEVDQETADSKAMELLVSSQSITRKVNISHVIVPGLTISDVVSVDYSTGGVSGAGFAIRTQDIDLGDGCIVKSEVRRSER